MLLCTSTVCSRWHLLHIKACVTDARSSP